MQVKNITLCCRYDAIITFRMRRSRGEMYIGHGCLCVCLSVPRRIPTLLQGPGCNLGNGRRCPLVVHYWADLQSVHGFRCYDDKHVCKPLYTSNAYSAEREMSASACTRFMAGVITRWDDYHNARFVHFSLSRYLWPPCVADADIIFSSCGFFFLLLFSSPNLSSRRLDVYHTATRGVTLVRI